MATLSIRVGANQASDAFARLQHANVGALCRLGVTAHRERSTGALLELGQLSVLARSWYRVQVR
jgi:hypothetical protein